MNSESAITFQNLQGQFNSKIVLAKRALSCFRQRINSAFCSLLKRPDADAFKHLVPGIAPAPDNKYQMTSGTSFSAAYVSGLAALMLERNPALKPDEVRAILTKTARDLGAAGRDDLFGAGEADAYAAVLAVAAAPIAVGSEPPALKSVPDQQDVPATRGLEQPAAATLASGKPADGDPKPGAQ